MPHLCEEKLEMVLDWKWALVEIRIPPEGGVGSALTRLYAWFWEKREKKQQFVLMTSYFCVSRDTYTLTKDNK